jgi:hypothetical protein
MTNKSMRERRQSLANNGYLLVGSARRQGGIEVLGLVYGEFDAGILRDLEAGLFDVYVVGSGREIRNPESSRIIVLGVPRGVGCLVDEGHSGMRNAFRLRHTTFSNH